MKWLYVLKKEQHFNMPTFTQNTVHLTPDLYFNYNVCYLSPVLFGIAKSILGLRLPG